MREFACLVYIWYKLCFFYSYKNCFYCFKYLWESTQDLLHAIKPSTLSSSPSLLPLKLCESTKPLTPPWTRFIKTFLCKCSDVNKKFLKVSNSTYTFQIQQNYLTFSTCPTSLCQAKIFTSELWRPTSIQSLRTEWETRLRLFLHVKVLWLPCVRLGEYLFASLCPL